MRKSLLLPTLALVTFLPFLLRCGGGDGGASASSKTIDGSDASILVVGDGGDGGGLDSSMDAADAAPKLPAKSAGCGMPATASGTNGDAKTVKSGGVDRSFVLYVPQGYDPNRNYPVVVLFHGIDATGPEMAAYIQMQVYSAGDAIVAFPTALNGKWDLSGPTDLVFFDDLMSSLESTLCVNEQRVFALGFSYGAYMANHLGCQRSAALRAFVAADGSFEDPNSSCAPTAALVYHRLDDDNEPIAGGEAARDKWLAINGCASTNTPVTGFGFQGLGCVQYDGCGATTPLLWCEDTDTAPPDYKHDLRDVYRVPIWNWFNHF